MHFECTGCGDCCAGPEEGYIWIVKKEIGFLAEHLGETVEDVKKKYLKRIGRKHSIKEDKHTKDCIFLTAEKDGCRGCAIYPVRPNQCRTWPFWSFNLHTTDQWNMAAVRCPGINRGKFYSFEEIETIMKQKQWWDDK
ncbi:MAG: YkgJ family cysteine cluster protein [Planctomycetota bacterium]